MPDAAPLMEVSATPVEPLGMSPTQFLRDYWQKHPVLIRAAVVDFTLPLSADDLAGLSCEEAVLSRLVLHDADSDRWSLRSGPFAEKSFATLPPDHWTLLVQDVDKWDVDVAGLLELVGFLPRWRIDDIMVSYAEDGGGVGPHVDQYDVFLLQGSGQRRWQINTDPDAPRACRDDVELRQLEYFSPSHEWILDPGDMLYLPPGVPHNGVAVGPGMTFSIGMRAPECADMLVDLAEYLAARMGEERRYVDPDLAPVTDVAEIDAAALANVRRALGPFANALTDIELALWFGGFITRYRSAQIAASREPSLTAKELAAALAQGQTLLRHPFSRMAWTRRGKDAILFAAGHRYPMSLALARSIGNGSAPELPRLELHGEDAAAVLGLINDGHLLLQVLP